MNFSTVQRVLQTIRAGDEVEWTRGENRVKINNAANGVPPLPEELAKRLNIKINVNWGELMVLLANARRQYLTAFWSTPYFFKIELPLAPSEFQSEWGAALTELINSKMRDSLSYFELHRSRWAQVCAHGIGPVRWRSNSDDWCPKCVAIEDLRIPTDTTLDFDDNLGWYAIRFIYTPYELLKNAFDDHPANKKWDRKGVAQILKNYKEINYDYAPNHYDWETTPEKFAELAKQDGGYFSSDAMPGIPLWHFYFQDDTKEGNEGWWMRIVPETGYVKGTPNSDKFLWTSNAPITPTWKQVLHCQFGDLSNKAPFLYHAVRSLGFVLLEPTFYTNLTRCRMLQHVHDNFNIWLRITDPPDKARALMQEFANMQVLRTGVNVVPQGERHQIDAELVDSSMAQLKQLMNEASSTYTQQTDTGTKKEQTAFETSVKLQQVNALMSGLLLTAFVYAKHEYKEICRRFCIRPSKNADVQDVQQAAHKLGIPAKWMDSRLWKIEPVSPIGMGNPALAEAKMQQLMAIRPAFDETAQQEILHESALVLTQDPRKAARWVPLGKKRAMTDSQRDAMSIFGTLMQGVLVPPREGLSPAEQLDTIIPLMAGVISNIERRDNVGTPDEIAGLKTVAEYAGTLIQQMAQDPNRKQIVKQAGDALGKLMNQVKGLEQRGQEKAQQAGQQQMDPAAMAKVQATMMQSNAKLQAKQAEVRQKLKMKEQEFVRGQRRKDAETYAELGRKAVTTRADARAQQLRSLNSGNGAKSRE